MFSSSYGKSMLMCSAGRAARSCRRIIGQTVAGDPPLPPTLFLRNLWSSVGGGANTALRSVSSSISSSSNHRSNDNSRTTSTNTSTSSSNNDRSNSNRSNNNGSSSEESRTHHKGDAVGGGGGRNSSSSGGKRSSSEESSRPTPKGELFRGGVTMRRSGRSPVRSDVSSGDRNSRSETDRRRRRSDHPMERPGFRGSSEDASRVDSGGEGSGGNSKSRRRARRADVGSRGERSDGVTLGERSNIGNSRSSSRSSGTSSSRSSSSGGNSSGDENCEMRRSGRMYINRNSSSSSSIVGSGIAKSTNTKGGGVSALMGTVPIDTPPPLLVPRPFGSPNPSPSPSYRRDVYGRGRGRGRGGSSTVRSGDSSWSVHRRALDKKRKIKEAREAKRWGVAHLFRITDMGKRGDWQGIAKALMHTSPFKHLQVNAFHFSAAISAFSRVGRWRGALALLEEMKQRGLNPNAVVYAAAIDACAKGSQPEKAVELLAEMKSKGVKPNVVVYSAAMNATARTGRLQGAVDLLQEMEENGVEANGACYAVLIDALQQDEREEDADLLYAQAVSRGIFDHWKKGSGRKENGEQVMDLHLYTAGMSKAAIRHVIFTEKRKGRVLVIVGRGSGSRNGKSVLMPVMRAYLGDVLGIKVTIPKRGGGGALVMALD